MNKPPCCLYKKGGIDLLLVSIFRGFNPFKDISPLRMGPSEDLKVKLIMSLLPVYFKEVKPKKLLNLGTSCHHLFINQ